MKPTEQYIAKANGPRKYKSWYTCNYMDLSDDQTDFFHLLKNNLFPYKGGAV